MEANVPGEEEMLSEQSRNGLRGLRWFYYLFLGYFQEAQGILVLESSISCTGKQLSKKY